MSSAQGALDVIRPHRLEPDRGPPGAVVGEWFVDDVPGVDGAPEPAGFERDMVDHQLSQLRRRERSGGKPGRQLLVPDEVVAANFLVVGLGEGDQLVGLAPVEDAARRLHRRPFHRVLRRDGAKLIRRQPAIGLFVEQAGIERRAEIAAARGGRRLQRRARRGRQAGGQAKGEGPAADEAKAPPARFPVMRAPGAHPLTAPAVRPATM